MSHQRTYAIGLICGYLAGLMHACTHVEVAPMDDVCEREAALRGAECATVREFARPALNDLGHVELCVPARLVDAAEAINGPSRPSTSERFVGWTKGLVDPPCFWCCGPECGAGANAYNGSFCEVTP